MTHTTPTPDWLNAAATELPAGVLPLCLPTGPCPACGWSGSFYVWQHTLYMDRWAITCGDCGVLFSSTRVLDPSDLPP
jgi:hypothetical protein